MRRARPRTSRRIGGDEQIQPHTEERRGRDVAEGGIPPELKQTEPRPQQAEEQPFVGKLPPVRPDFLRQTVGGWLERRITHLNLRLHKAIG